MSNICNTHKYYYDIDINIGYLNCVISLKIYIYVIRYYNILQIHYVKLYGI